MAKRTYIYKFLGIVMLVAIVWIALQLDFKNPNIKLASDIKYIGRTQRLSLNISDEKSGLANIHVGILQDKKEAVVHSQAFPYSFSGKDRVHQKSLNLKIEPRVLGVNEGEAIFTISATDYARTKFFKGNELVLEQKVIIDTLPPSVNLLTSSHYLNQGGSGLIIYEIPGEIAQSGVKVEKLFFPGFKTKLSGREVYLTYFAVPYNVDPSFVKIALKAQDYAGNETSVPFPYHVRAKTFRKDKINISESFLSKISPQFASRPGSPDNPLEIFLWANGALRKDGHQIINKICSKSHQEQLWKGSFLRLKRSKPMAGYADERAYYYGGKKVDRQVHLGVDLASTAHSRVEAANNGIVSFAGDLGIYGNTIILDHGLGLFSMYGHLSNIRVTNGQKVRKGELIGYTGSTGLAGGDHLHFSMIISGVFVNPTEWWDEHWIHDNITLKHELCLKNLDLYREE